MSEHVHSNEAPESHILSTEPVSPDDINHSSGRLNGEKQEWVPPRTQVQVLVKQTGSGLMMTQSHQDLSHIRIKFILTGVMDVLVGRAFYILLSNLSRKPVHIPKHMCIAAAGEVPDIMVRLDSMEQAETNVVYSK